MPETETYQILSDIVKLQKQLKYHTGATGASSTSQLPHPNMHIDSVYTVTNGTTDRTYDADTVVVAELADIVATLIADLKILGILT